MPGWLVLSLEIGVVVLTTTLFLRSTRAKAGATLPPGPPGLPVVGNVLDMPVTREWEVYREWGQKWGGILSVKLLGQPLIIVNSAHVMEQLDKNSAIYSDRPRLVMAGELVGYVKTVVLLPYGAKFRNFRKHIGRLIGTPAATSKFYPVEEQETRSLMRRIVANPNDITGSLRKASGTLIMKMTYGIEVQERNDPFVALIEQANDNFSIACTPGMFLVDVFPFMRHIPDWVPGANFKRLAKKWRKAFDDMVEEPYAFAKQLIAAGNAHSFISSALESEQASSPEYIDEIKHTAASLYGAGADTTVSAQHAFFLAMILHPDVQKAAQAEIDAVIGHDRLPTFADRENLPYVNAVVTEALRWHNVAPLGVPHSAMEDGIVDGYLVPKGSIIITNLWAMLHDPEVYPDPFVFDPTRYIPTPGREVQRDPRHACFGYARRRCPGMHLAEASLYICIVMALATLEMKPVIRDGVPIMPVHENTSGTISHTPPFEIDIKPRSQKAFSLLMAES